MDDILAARARAVAYNSDAALARAAPVLSALSHGAGGPAVDAVRAAADRVARVRAAATHVADAHAAAARGHKRPRLSGGAVTGPVTTGGYVAPPAPPPPIDPRVAFAGARDAYLVRPPNTLDAPGGWAAVLITDTLKVYRAAGEPGSTPDRRVHLLVAARGTATEEDAAANGALVASTLVSSPRYKKDASAFAGLLARAPPTAATYYFTGHSLGGAIAQALIRDFATGGGRGTGGPGLDPRPGQAAYFNSANQPIDLVAPLPGAAFWYADGDPLGAAAAPFWTAGGPRAPQIIVPPHRSPLDAHSWSSFEGVLGSSAAATRPHPHPSAAGSAAGGGRVPPAYTPPGGVAAPPGRRADGLRVVVPGAVPLGPPRPPGTGSGDLSDGGTPSVYESALLLTPAGTYAAGVNNVTTSLATRAALAFYKVNVVSVLPPLVEAAFRRIVAANGGKAIGSGRPDWDRPVWSTPPPLNKARKLSGGSAASAAAHAHEPEAEQASVPLSDGDIKTLVPGARIFTYPELVAAASKGGGGIDGLFSNNRGPLVILFLTESHTSGHWTAVLRHDSHLGGDRLEYFDPYGGRPDAPMTWLTPERRAALGETAAVLTKLLHESPLPVDYSGSRLQRQGGDVNTCGRHVVVRLWHAHDRLPAYLQWMSRACGRARVTPDVLVTRSTATALAHLHARGAAAT